MKSAQVQKCTLDSFEIFIFCRGSHHDNDVQPCLQYVLMQPETLSHQPDHPVTDHAVSHLLAHGNPNSGMSPLRSPHVHDQETVGEGLSLPVNQLKVSIFFDRMKSFHYFK